MTKKILVTTKMMQDVEFYNNFLPDFELTFRETSQRFSESECLDFVGGHDAWICGDDEITEQVLLASQPKLKLLIKWGAGYDSIATDSAKEIGIDFRSTPNSLSNAVAEYALGLIFCLLRDLPKVDRSTREGLWLRPTGNELAMSTIGIIGMGSVGGALGEKLENLGCEVIFTDPAVEGSIALDSVLRKSDIVVVSAPLNESTWNLLNKDKFSIMKPEALLVNVARGGIVNEIDLLQALDKRIISGAALDVFSEEPLISSPLGIQERIILGSHNASNTWQAKKKADLTIKNIINEFFED